MLSLLMYTNTTAYKEVHTGSPRCASFLCDILIRHLLMTAKEMLFYSWFYMRKTQWTSIFKPQGGKMQIKPAGKANCTEFYGKFNL